MRTQRVDYEGFVNVERLQKSSTGLTIESSSFFGELQGTRTSEVIEIRISEIFRIELSLGETAKSWGEPGREKGAKRAREGRERGARLSIDEIKVFLWLFCLAIADV